MANGTTVRMWRRSLFVLIMIVFFGFSLVCFRLFQLQIVNGEDLQKRAIEQQMADTKISAQRGTIYDCNMKPLAQSATVWTVVLEPAYLKTDEEKELVACGLSEILEMDKNALLEKAKKKSYYIVIKRKVETDVKDKIIKFKNDNKISNGIRLIEDYKRYYPYGNFASAILGFTGTDSQGLSGLEAYYDKELTGEAGRLITAKNAIGTDMPFDYEQKVPSKDGNNLVLSIDEVIQHFIEKNLEEGVINNKVKNRAAAIMMNVNTGEIIGLSVKGDYNPNEPFVIADEETLKEVESLPESERDVARSVAWEKQWRNKAVSDTYYPGSVFKMITECMGIEENVISENDHLVNCTGSFIPYQGASCIHCHKRTGHGSLTAEEALLRSCNPGFIVLGQKVGAEKFYQYYTAFGFSEKTGIDLPGEASDIFFSADGSMTQMDLAVASFGQNFSITPIQMLTAASAIANGGRLVKPHVVKQIIDSNGNIVKSMETIVKRNVISEDTAKRVTQMLYKNVNTKEGSGKNGYVAGYRVCGKTGTSEKIGCSGADGKDYIASFCGFAPADNPQVAMLVYFDTPKGESYYGSAVAAPVFAKIMQDVLPYLGIEKKYTEEEIAQLETAAPSIVDKSIGEARNIVQSSGLIPIVLGEGEKVVSQIPEPSKSIRKGGTIVLYTDKISTNESVQVPKLVGLSMMEANKVIAYSKLNISIKGASMSDGEVVSSNQSIPEGTLVKPGTVITVEFIQKDNIR